MRVVTFDIETTGNFSRGSWKPEDLELTICCVHDSVTGEYYSYLKEELPKLWQLLEDTDVLVGYNSDHFDIPILNKYYPGDLARIRSLDLMKEVQGVIGRRIKLDSLAEGTLGKKKIADGRQAIRWWNEGNIKKLREYCLKDVEITRQVFEHALEHGHLKYKELGTKKEVKLDTSNWLTHAGGSALTKTLGF